MAGEEMRNNCDVVNKEKAFSSLRIRRYCAILIIIQVGGSCHMRKNRRKRKVLLTAKFQTKMSLEKEFELREKSLKLTYKIFYVVAAGWAGLLLLYIKSAKVERMICSGMLAILTTLLFSILSFVFHEFRCLNIFKDTDDEKKR